MVGRGGVEGGDEPEGGEGEMIIASGSSGGLGRRRFVVGRFGKADWGAS